MERNVNKNENLPLHTGTTVKLKTETQQHKVGRLPDRKKLKLKKARYKIISCKSLP